jgi:hypothetical protein
MSHLCMPGSSLAFAVAAEHCGLVLFRWYVKEFTTGSKLFCSPTLCFVVAKGNLVAVSRLLLRVPQGSQFQSVHCASRRLLGG